MSLESVLGERFAGWRDELFDWGFELEEPPRPATVANQIVVFARWPRNYEPLDLTITIEELWLPGRDPDGLAGTAIKHCHLKAASWHAQFGDPPELAFDRRAERLDLDRSKRPSLMIHRHPYGEVEGVRRPESRLPAPGLWLERVSELIAKPIAGLDDVDDVD